MAVADEDALDSIVNLGDESSPAQGKNWEKKKPFKCWIYFFNIYSVNFQFHSNFSASKTQQLEIFKQDLQCFIPSKLFSLWISKEF